MPSAGVTPEWGQTLGFRRCGVSSQTGSDASARCDVFLAIRRMHVDGFGECADPVSRAASKSPARIIERGVYINVSNRHPQGSSTKGRLQLPRQAVKPHSNALIGGHLQTVRSPQTSAGRRSLLIRACIDKLAKNIVTDRQRSVVRRETTKLGLIHR